MNGRRSLVDGGSGASGAPPPRERGPSTDRRVVALRERAVAGLVRALDRELESVAEAVAEPVRYAVLGPGKRFRPVTFLAVYETVRGGGGSANGGAGASGAGPADDPAAELSCSVELVHAYSLIHDDMPCMDDDVLRRGRPSLHVRFGVRAAAVAGAVLMPLAARLVWRAGGGLDLGEGERRRLLGTLARASGGAGMVGGQLRDLRAEGRAVDRAELERIHRGKTAALFAAAVRMGAIAAGASRATEEALTRFGRKLGLAFQAVDDILDVTGVDGRLGKPSGRDAALEKATYPSVVGLEEARRASRRLAREAVDELPGLEGEGVLRALVGSVVARRR